MLLCSSCTLWQCGWETLLLYQTPLMFFLKVHWEVSYQIEESFIGRKQLPEAVIEPFVHLKDQQDSFL